MVKKTKKKFKKGVDCECENIGYVKTYFIILFKNDAWPTLIFIKAFSPAPAK